MKKFMVLVLGGKPFEDDAERDANMKAWTEYTEELAKAGKLESGLPSKPEGVMVQGHGDHVHASEIPGDQSVFGGYLILNAEDMDEAISLLDGCPHIEMDGALEVHELLEKSM